MNLSNLICDFSYNSYPKISPTGVCPLQKGKGDRSQEEGRSYCWDDQG
jgi:hypothetical protein